MIRIVITLALLFTSGRSTAAQDAPKLRELVTVTTELVRVGDLVDNAGPAANIAIFRAPDLGHTGTVQIERIADALKSHDITGLDTGGLTEVIVTRLSRAVTVQEIEERIARALAGQNGFGDAKNLALVFDRGLRPLHLDASAQADLTVTRLNVEPRTGRFDISLEIPGSAVSHRQPLRFTGTVTETVETATLSRSVARGDTIRESDVTVERRPKIEVGGEPIDAEQAIGMSAKRALKAGLALRAGDLMKSDVVNRNDAVTIVYEVPGIVLTVRGKALEAGALGELISVLNVQSNRTVQGVVSGPGLITLTSTTPRFAAAAPSSSDRRRRAQ